MVTIVTIHLNYLDRMTIIVVNIILYINNFPIGETNMISEYTAV